MKFLIGKKTITATLTATALTFSGAALADFKVRAGLTSVNYKADITFSNKSVSANPTYNGVALGFTYITEGGTYIDLAPTLAQAGEAPSGWDSQKATRFDGTLVIGSSTVLDSGSTLSYYIGFKNGYTKFYFEDATDSTGYREQNLHSHGPITGLGYGYPLGDKGLLIANIGIGLNTATVAEKDIDTSSSENALGYSYSLGYTYPFSSSSGVTLDYKGNIYKFTMKQNTTNGPTQFDESWTLMGISGYMLF